MSVRIRVADPDRVFERGRIRSEHHGIRRDPNPVNFFLDGRIRIQIWIFLVGRIWIRFIYRSDPDLDPDNFQLDPRPCFSIYIMVLILNGNSGHVADL